MTLIEKHFLEVCSERSFQTIKFETKKTGCKRAILVGHNAHFDLAFINAAVERCKIKKNPLHPFSCFDTATLAGLAYGQTVLAKACEAANINFESERAHDALYDAKKLLNYSAPS